MKKSIIAAGAASLALAAMPALNTFAAQRQVTDNIEINLASTCTIGRVGNSGANGTWRENASGEEGQEGYLPGETYTANMTAGSTAVLGTSNFTIICNDPTNTTSLSVTATGLAVEGADPAQTINYSPAAVADNASSWNIAISLPTGEGATSFTSESWVADSLTNTGSYVNITNQSQAKTIYSSAAKISNGKFNATYNVGVSNQQTPGTYTGSATYTLSYGA